jgi:predicted ABC-type ATPase
VIDFAHFDQRPAVVAIAGPNGAGKTTFYHAHLAAAGLRFVNADLLSQELALNPYDAARLANTLRGELVHRGESFVFETVFSDPVGDKVAFLEEAVRAGYLVVLCYIGIESSDVSEQRVAMRVSQGGHDVPEEKLRERFPRILANLGKAIQRLPHVLIYDNSDLSRPYRQVALFEGGQLQSLSEPVPGWLKPFVEPSGGQGIR